MTLRLLRIVSHAEGFSLLCLLFWAMPLKYAFAAPWAVRIAGSLHGVLSLALLLVAFQVLVEDALDRKSVGRVILLSLIPFGFVWAERLVFGHERGS